MDRFIKRGQQIQGIILVGPNVLMNPGTDEYCSCQQWNIIVALVYEQKVNQRRFIPYDS